MKRIRIAVVGSGFGLYGLLPAFNSLSNCIVVAICGNKTKRLLDYCQHIGLQTIYSNWKEMLENETIDAIAIATSPNVQYAIAKIAIIKKINIFAEKPLTANVLQAKNLFNLAKKNNIIHTIDFIFPEIDVWQKTKKLLEKETLGKLKYVSVQWSFLSFDIKNRIVSWKTSRKEGGGALAFYFSHTLYYLEYFVGEISNVKSKFFYSNESMNEGEVGVDLLLQFGNGIRGDAHLTCNSRGMHKHQLTFICEKGKIILENTDKVVDGFTLTIYRENKKEIVKSHEQTQNNEDERVKIVRKLASKFINACIQRKQMTPSFKEGVRVQQLIEKIRKEQINE